MEEEDYKPAREYDGNIYEIAYCAISFAQGVSDVLKTERVVEKDVQRRVTEIIEECGGITYDTHRALGLKSPGVSLEWILIRVAGHDPF
jgi:hypothetical protein